MGAAEIARGPSAVCAPTNHSAAGSSNGQDLAFPFFSVGFAAFRVAEPHGLPMARPYGVYGGGTWSHFIYFYHSCARLMGGMGTLSPQLISLQGALLGGHHCPRLVA